MKIRDKILLYFSLTSITLVGVTFILIYSLFSRYRLDQFQERIKEQTKNTLLFLSQAKELNEEMVQSIDNFVINNFFKEKILIYDENKVMIYSSIDDTKINFPRDLLKELSAEQTEVGFYEDEYDVVGIYFQFEGKNYYGIAKAYDQAGLEKLQYLLYVLIFSYALIVTIILLTSYWLSNQISNPLKKMTEAMTTISLETENKFIEVPDSKDEIKILATQFNVLMKRLNESFAFQKHVVNHISHELKTPIAILVSNFEKMENETDLVVLKKWIEYQKKDTKNLSDIINVLLELSKVESGNELQRAVLRVDDLIFDIIEQLQMLHEDFSFEIILEDSIIDESNLMVEANEKLLRLAFVNLAINCIQYSNRRNAKIKISYQKGLIISFINSGETIQAEEKQFLFQHFFRGKNSIGKRGFGLGLVFINRILNVHNATIFYTAPNHTTNVFEIHFSNQIE